MLRLRGQPLALRLATTASLVGLAFAVHYAVYDRSPELPFLFFMPTVAVASVAFGRAAGLFATALSALCGTYFLLDEVEGHHAVPWPGWLSFFLFILAGSVVAFGVEALHTAYGQANQARRKADEERRRAEAGERTEELLLAELQHRIGNDLQRIVAVMELRARRSSRETQAALKEATGMVQVIARLHGRLVHRDGRMLIDVRAFLQELIADISSSLSPLRAITISLEAEAHALPPRSTTAIGLIVNELVTNALKHAFPHPEQHGTIRVQFRRDDATFVLTVADNGTGALPSDAVAKTLGQGLIRALAAELDGHLDVEAVPGTGTRFELRFPA